MDPKGDLGKGIWIWVLELVWISGKNSVITLRKKTHNKKLLFFQIYVGGVTVVGFASIYIYI